MFDKPIDQLTKPDIDRLVTDGVPEGTQLDYKETFPQNWTESDRKEFAKDVSAFANARGGFLVYGVAEKDGVATFANGLDNIVVDDEIQRLDNIARDRIDPRVPDVKIQPIPGFPKGPVIVVQVPRSWIGPHMVSTNDSRFWSRANNANYSLNVNQIRDAFERGRELPRMLRALLDERLALIADERAPVQLRRLPCTVMHFMPIALLGSGEGIDVQNWAGAMNMITEWGRYGHYNADGYACTYAPVSHDQQITYAQAFRNGMLEAVRVLDVFDEGKHIVPYHVENFALKQVRHFEKLAGGVGLTGPVSVFLTIVNAIGLTCEGDREPWEEPVQISRALLTLPDALLEPPQPSDAKRLLRQAFDTLWQSMGLARSPSYDESGNWTRATR